MSDKDLQLGTLRRAFAQDLGEAAGGCPQPELLWAGARGELPEKDLEALLDHLAVCSACAADWRLAFELVRPRNPVVVLWRPVVVLWRRRDTRRLVTALTSVAAAGLLVVVGLELMDRRGATETVAAERAGDETPLRSLVEGNRLSRDAAVLRWTEVPGARYDVEVRTPDDDLQLITSASGLARPEFQIPAADLSRFAAGAKLQWQVTAVLPDGGREPSAVFTFELR